MNEELKKLFNSLGQDLQLSEEVLEKLSKIFETAVDAKVASILDEKEEELKDEMLQEATETKENLIDKMDEYFTEAVEEYVLELGDDVVNATKVAIYEELFEKVKESFASTGLNLEEGSTDIVRKLTEEKEDLSDSLNGKMKELHEAREELLAQRALNIFIEETADMTLSDREKLKVILAETEFKDENEAKEKIVLMKEYFENSDKDKEKDESKKDKKFVNTDNQNVVSRLVSHL